MYFQNTMMPAPFVSGLIKGLKQKVQASLYASSKLTRVPRLLKEDDDSVVKQNVCMNDLDAWVERYELGSQQELKRPYQREALNCISFFTNFVYLLR